MTKSVKDQVEKVSQKFRDRKGCESWQVQLWLNARNPHMNEMTPIEAILKGHFERVMSFLDDGVWK